MSSLLTFLISDMRVFLFFEALLQAKFHARFCFVLYCMDLDRAISNFLIPSMKDFSALTKSDIKWHFQAIPKISFCSFLDYPVF